jgi:hypothetical protein
MDPLSITASIIAVVTAAKHVSSTLAEIRRDWKTLPGRLHALHNEIQDLSVVLHQVASAAEEQKLGAKSHATDGNLAMLLRQGLDSLAELQAILGRLLPAGKGKREAISGVMAWRREMSAIARLQEDVKRAKSSFNVLLGASHSSVFVPLYLSQS